MESMELIGQLKEHAKGKRGADSFAGVFYWASTQRNLMKDDQEYSSVKFSGHITSKTMFKESHLPLYKFITEHPLQVLGEECAKSFKNQLPFRIKILSIDKSTPLFCCPPKEHAERLHKLYPLRYPDAEHKPKMTIAIKFLEVLAGFRKREEIIWFLNALPELAICAPYVMIEDFLCTGKERYLKDILHFIFNAAKLEIKLAVEILFKRLEKADNGTKSALLFGLVEKLHAQQPYDAGIFFPYFFNHIILKPGQAIYIPPGLPHCYVMGDGLEVTTCSKTFLKCGLTLKFKDIPEFLKVADFKPYSPDKLLLKPTTIDLLRSVYCPPVQEFNVNRINVPKEITYTLPVSKSCSMLLVTRGQGTLEDHRRIALGTTLLVLPYEKLTVYSKSDLTMYTVYVNLGFTPTTQ